MVDVVTLDFLPEPNKEGEEKSNTPKTAVCFIFHLNIHHQAKNAIK